MTEPRLLDLFCGAGGAAVGYARAGWTIVGVDIVKQPHYPFVMSVRDALEVAATYTVDAIHASPPCQAFTAYQRTGRVGDYPDLIAATRELLASLGTPYVIENVVGAPLRDPVLLCGSMFDPPLDVQRHRLFETNWPLHEPPWGCRHKIWSRRFKSSTGRKPNSRFTIEVGSWDEPLERQKAAMGVDWPITVRELSEAIPPAFTEFIGAQLLAFLALPGEAAA